MIESIPIQSKIRRQVSIGTKFPVTGDKYPYYGKWHFISRRGELVFKKSKVLQRLRNQKSKLAFMDK